MRLSLLLTSLCAGAALAAPAKPVPKPQAPAASIRALQFRVVDPSRVPSNGTAGNSDGPVTVFQTSQPYDPRIDLKTDLVAVHGHGRTPDQIDQTIQSWRGAGYPVHRMFFIGSDAGQIYTGGGRHADEIETDFQGKPIVIGNRPYMVPTAGWLDYLKGEIRRAIDSGATGIWPEEPLLHAAGGYSPAFKTAWDSLYHAPWEDPQSSPAAFFRGSQLKADLYLRAVEELRRYTKEYAQQQGKDVKFFLPVHSAVSFASWKLVFPHAAAAKLPVDGIVAQVWTGPARSPVTYEGKTGPRVFESSFAMYSYFANLLNGQADKQLFFLADPVEDDPSFSWPDYQRWYQEVVAASLFFPQPRGYEVLPWPERIFLPGRSTGGGTPGPEPYRTEITNVLSALKELGPGEPVQWQGATRGIGVVTLDTMMWQRGGPSGSSMRSLHGLMMPLLARGVPVEVVPGERAVDPGYLARFKVLLLSYDMQKPLGPEVNRALADWVKAGGALIVLGGEDAYNRIGEWWSKEGYDGPTDHLLHECGIGADVHQRTVRNATGRYQELIKAERPVHNLENRQTYSIPLGRLQTQGQPVYLRFSDVTPQDGWGAWVGRVQVRDQGRIRADFVAGSPAERAFLVEDNGSKAGKDHRFADGDASFVYRFSRLGPEATLDLELGNGFRVSAAVGADPGVSLQPIAPGLAPLRVSADYPLVSYPVTGVDPLYKSAAPDTTPAWSARVGSGYLLYCGVPAAFGADSVAGSGLITSLARFAAGKVGLTYAEGPLIARRGPYVVAHSLGKAVQLKGEYLDLFHADMPLLKDPRLPLREPVLYKQVQLVTRIPVLLHASQRARLLEGTVKQMRLQLDGPKDTPGVLRIFRAGQSVASVEAVDAANARPIPVETVVDGQTVRVRYPQSPEGMFVVIKWMRPEARLTK